jgi:hypothetical protein
VSDHDHEGATATRTDRTGAGTPQRALGATGVAIQVRSGRWHLWHARGDPQTHKERVHRQAQMTWEAPNM